MRETHDHLGKYTIFFLYFLLFSRANKCHVSKDGVRAAAQEAEATGALGSCGNISVTVSTCHFSFPTLLIKPSLRRFYIHRKRCTGGNAGGG